MLVAKEQRSLVSISKPWPCAGEIASLTFPQSHILERSPIGHCGLSFYDNDLWNAGSAIEMTRSVSL
jgi:hypothetical protein